MLETMTKAERKETSPARGNVPATAADGAEASG